MRSSLVGVHLERLKPDLFLKMVDINADLFLHCPMDE